MSITPTRVGKVNRSGGKRPAASLDYSSPITDTIGGSATPRMNAGSAWANALITPCGASSFGKISSASCV